MCLSVGDLIVNEWLTFSMGEVTENMKTETLDPSVSGDQRGGCGEGNTVTSVASLVEHASSMPTVNPFSDPIAQIRLYL
jgi:hypothetical protein